jgi:hypothetical protein
MRELGYVRDRPKLPEPRFTYRDFIDVSMSQRCQSGSGRVSPAARNWILAVFYRFCFCLGIQRRRGVSKVFSQIAPCSAAPSSAPRSCNTPEPVVLNLASAKAYQTRESRTYCPIRYIPVCHQPFRPRNMVSTNRTNVDAAESQDSHLKSSTTRHNMSAPYEQPKDAQSVGRAFGFRMFKTIRRGQLPFLLVFFG